MTESPAQHPWAKYYTERGLSRPELAELPTRPRVRINNTGARAAVRPAKAPAELSPELAAAVAAVVPRRPLPGSTAAPFITAMQKEAVARELKRLARIRYARLAAAAVAVLVLLHVTVTRFVCQAPAENAIEAHVRGLPQAVLPFFSTPNQPLQAESVKITQADRIDAEHFRYVASVTLRLRQPLYVPAVSNGTAAYRRLQQALETARDQELRFQLFNATEAPETPELPLLLQQSHRAGETIVVRVPFVARRFGWQWRLEAPQLALQNANRAFEGDSIERYAARPHLIFGAPDTLADIRQRVKLANNYVLAVAKEVQRHADVEAVAEVAATDLSIADRPAQAAESSADALANIEARPAIDPDAPAVFSSTPPHVVTLDDRGGGAP